MSKINQKIRAAVKAALVLSVVVFMLSLTACKPKEPITANIFTDKVEKLEYTVTDITDEYSEFPHILKALLCEDKGMHVEFAEINSNDSAEAVFNGNRTQVEVYKGSSSAEAYVSTGSYQKYTLKTDEKYYLLERVGATFIYAYCDKAEVEKLNSIIKELGY